MSFKAGFVALVGRPNVGKSTLLNNILGTKLSIVSPKPQTTRMRILGVKHLPDAQIIFLDAPGVQKGGDLLSKSVLESAVASMEDADVIVMIIEADKGWTKEDKEIVENYIKKYNKPVILAINKIDKIQRDLVLPLIEESTKIYDFKEYVPISAIKNINIDELLNTIKKYLPESPPLYPEDMITDLPLKLWIAEIIREKVFFNTKQEVPYSVAVEVESIKEGEKNKNLLIIDAVIYVERDNHKGIIIGKKGQMLKKIGSQAREELEFLLGKKVHLNLYVKVKENWKEDLPLLRSLGYNQIS
ncbi:GTPase Era [Sulfurihydrogenibium azorense]|jgi:GTP-binding protein Era|uniref:GTPase Era n=1 Tax=Sulfurihydrogenibium azorense (strain DSM 15241 / OCM 825 / Az-Fu1) TaxID=204536 RepID=C1DWJ8_SULAA|nr:GTPase Era [Sulfurihydrogenibium azorense]ACN98718.1 GTP-binding protein Era [Sulfurihydrogenibium azorense Az-Fu1]MDM7273292.1 GTPase Era [Sulfurihydrogenibium azorense]